MEYIRNEAGVVGFSDAWKIRFYKWLEFPKNLAKESVRKWVDGGDKGTVRKIR
jgi:hypothetical protein